MILASNHERGTFWLMSLFKIAVCGRKGGVGKTATATTLASYFAHHDMKVLVVDLDPQSNAGFVLGVDPLAPGTAELILKKSPTPCKASENLYVLPGGGTLQDRKVEQSDPSELAFAIQQLDKFDVIIFDCPPGNDLLERQGLVAADIALVCTNAHPLGILGAERVLGEIQYRQKRNQDGPKFAALIITQVNKSRALDKQVPGSLAAAHPDIPQFIIGQNTDIAWAGASETPFMQSNPGSKAIRDIEALARWVAQETVLRDMNDG